MIPRVFQDTDLVSRLVLTPVVAHKDKIRKRTGIEVVFTQSIIEYRIHRETCVLSKL